MSGNNLIKYRHELEHEVSADYLYILLNGILLKVKCKKKNSSSFLKLYPKLVICYFRRVPIVNPIVLQKRLIPTQNTIGKFINNYFKKEIKFYMYAKNIEPGIYLFLRIIMFIEKCRVTEDGPNGQKMCGKKEVPTISYIAERGG